MLLLLAALTLIPISMKAENEVSCVYVGGHIRRERPGTITTLRNSGFQYVILFNVHVDTDGTLLTDGETICKNGEYVFSNTQPNYQADIAKLKAEGSAISRIDICIGGWGNDSYGHIRSLIERDGTGPQTILYRNFKALLEAVPEIDGVNNDQEQDYDQNSAAKFHIMMYDIGYTTTLAPYMNRSYWQGLCKQIRAARPDAVERVMVQCYDGGAGNVNDVKNWTFEGVPNIHVGLCNEGNHGAWNVENNEKQYAKWRDEHGAKGGFVWVYNDNSWNLNETAASINRVFSARTCSDEEAMVEVFPELKFGGQGVKLPQGTFSQGQLALYGIKANDLASAKILREGVKARFFINPANQGTARTLSSDAQTLGTTYNNKICSITIEYTEPDPTATPTIAYEDGTLKFACETKGAVCTYTIEPEDAVSTTGESYTPTAVYHITATAKAKGFNPSEEAKATLIYNIIDPQQEEEEETAIFNVKSRALFVSSEADNITVTGLRENEEVAAYSLDGILIGTATSTSGKAVINATRPSENIVVLKVGDKSYKINLNK